MSESPTSNHSSPVAPRSAEDMPLHASTDQKPIRSKGAAATSQITSLESLFDYAYSLQGKQVRVPQKVLKDIADGMGVTDEPLLASLRDHLGALMVSDPLLAVPPRLLAGLENNGAPLRLKLRVARLFDYHLRRHPLFKPGPVREAEGQSTGSEQPGEFESWLTRARLRATDIAATDLGLSETTLKPPERERLRTNAITAVVLIGSLLEEWGDDRLVEVLERYLWRDALDKTGVHRSRVAIVESAPIEALAFVSKIFLDKVSDAAQAADRARHDAAQAGERAANLLNRANAANEEAERLRVEIEAKRIEIATLQERIEALRAENEAEKRDRIIDQSHHIDEYEVLRTRVVRLLGRQIDLLSDGLHAVRNQSYSVTEEFIERALDSMSRELRELDSKGGV